jgi:hypothetical protein
VAVCLLASIVSEWHNRLIQAVLAKEDELKAEGATTPELNLLISRLEHTRPGTWQRPRRLGLAGAKGLYIYIYIYQVLWVASTCQV